MSSANISSGAASCMKFNSSFLYYVGFFVLLVIGYMWGKRNGAKQEKKKEVKSEKKVTKTKAKTKAKSKKSKKSKKAEKSESE